MLLNRMEGANKEESSKGAQVCCADIEIIPIVSLPEGPTFEKTSGTHS